MDENHLRYKQCECCGNFFVVPSNLDPNKVLYCSPACRVKFDRCQVCGNYFDSTQNHSRELDDDIENHVALCSEECADIFYNNTQNRYFH